MAGDKVSEKTLSDLVTGGPGKTPSANAPKRPAKSRLLQMLDDEDAAYVQAGAAPPAQSGSSDPVTQGMTWLKANTPASFSLPGGVALPTPSPIPGLTMKQVLEYLPQDSVDAALLAVTGGTSAVAAPALRAGLPFVKYLSKAGVVPGLVRAALRGLVTREAGRATGHDPNISTARGAGGSMFGETVAAGVNAGLKRAANAQVLRTISTKFADWYRAALKGWLPKGASDAEVLRAVAGDEPARVVGAAINQVKARMAQENIPITPELEPVLRRHGIEFAKPVGRGTTVPGGVGTPVPGGNVWPPVRRFETPLGPGTPPAPPAQLPGGGVPVPSPGHAVGPGPAGPGEAMVPFGSIITQLDDALEMAAAQPPSPETFALVRRLNELRAKVADQLPDSADKTLLKDLYREYGRAKSAADLWWGAKGATRAHGETVGPFFQPAKAGEDAGLLSEAGYKTLAQRLGLNAPGLPYTEAEAAGARGLFSKAEVAAARAALHLPPEGGQVVGELGQGFDLGVRVGAGATGAPHVSLHPTLPTTGEMPGWEAAQNAGARLAPSAIRAILPQLPMKAADALSLTPAEAAEGPPSAPPGLAPAAPKVELPALPKLPSPEASAPQAGTQGAGWFPKFDEAEADQPEVTLEVTKKPGE